jgi:predicted metal-dependent hydrolase
LLSQDGHMKKKIQINGREITYELRKNGKSKRISIRIQTDASVVVSSPRFVPEIIIKNFLREKSDWIFKKIEEQKARADKRIPGSDKIDYFKKKAQAGLLIKAKLKKINENYGFKFKRVFIRNQKTRWGSCSRDGNLNFNYKLIYLPDALADYIVAHELCHLKELNHSFRFWSLVERVAPDYKERRKELRREGMTLF